MENTCEITLAILHDDMNVFIQEVQEKYQFNFKAHNSGYWGNYWLYIKKENRIKIYYNKDPMFNSKTDDPIEYYFDYKNKKCNILIYLHGDNQWVNEMQQVKPAIDANNELDYGEIEYLVETKEGFRIIAEFVDVEITGGLLSFSITSCKQAKLQTLRSALIEGEKSGDIVNFSIDKIKTELDNTK